MSTSHQLNAPFEFNYSYLIYLSVPHQSIWSYDSPPLEPGIYNLLSVQLGIIEALQSDHIPLSSILNLRRSACCIFPCHSSSSTQCKLLIFLLSLVQIY